MGDPTPNPLMSSQKSSQLQTVLHPLVLLTISDYITRHTVREQQVPIVGALLGQQNGREITIEHAFECHLRSMPDVEGGYLLDAHKFGARLDQMCLVHRDRKLEFVGWYTLLPKSGPTPTVLPLHSQILEGWNESAILLGFHPQEALNRAACGKLPLTIYESSYEVDDAKGDDSEDKNMEDGEATLKLKFREVPYTVETDETEMISMNDVAGGGGSAAAMTTKEERPARSIETNGKGKRRLVESSADGTAEGKREPSREATDEFLSREEEEMVASLTAKANAIKMLQSRIRLLARYLERLPPPYIRDADSSPGFADADRTVPSLPMLRQIHALVGRLGLVVPSDTEAFDREALQQSNDVHLVGLLNAVVQSVKLAREVGKKTGVVESAKSATRRAAADFFLGSSSFSFSRAADIFY